MSDRPAEVHQAVAEAIAKGIVGLRGVGAEMDSETEHWGRVLAGHALEAAARSEDSERAWDTAFSRQRELCAATSELIDEAAGKRTGTFRAAMIACLIEELSEKLRASLHLPATDAQEEQPQ